MSEETQHIDIQIETTLLYADVCQIIDDTRSRIAVYVNSEICHTNWLVGKRIKEDVLFNQRAEYGKQVVKGLSIKLTERYGAGWSLSTLQHCIRAASLLRRMRFCTRAYTIQLDTFKNSFEV